MDEAVSKAKRFIERGYREIVVTGCNLSMYASKGKRLPDLVAALADIAPASAGAGNTCRIRLGSLEPSPVCDEVLSVVAERPNACRYLHIPIQSGSSRILVSMRRPYTVRDIDNLVRKARELVPDVEIGCDLMTGFPGETEMDFLATKGLVDRIRPSRVHVFPFSERPGTIAASMLDVIPHAERKRRAQTIADDADKLRSEIARRYAGRTVELVVEDDKACAGWTSEYFWCSCPRVKAKRRSLVKVKVRESDGHMLIGEPC
jgi:threonylcarbamoyladenosine tRNA methylthiotransferase MtaB